MSPMELLAACVEAEKLAEGTDVEPGIRIMVSGVRRGKTVKVCAGLSGENLGDYVDSDGKAVTHVFLKTSSIKLFLRKWFESRL